MISISVYWYRRNPPPENGASVRQPSARRRHWGNAVPLGTLLGAGTDGSLLKQERDYRRNIQTPPSYPQPLQQLACAQSHESKRCRRATQCEHDVSHASCSDYHLLQRLQRFRGKCLTVPPIVPILLPTTTICYSTRKGSWPRSISTLKSTCRRLSHAGSALRRRISSAQVYRNWCYGMTRASVSVILMLRGS
ncbi:hypothetical protein AVEN_179490-1 [Araneus ventricosus]|uniref:Uncharacterized protein n=1 Tax=Araneus ventricosus TaxID=182803 RepID=A0A4Y2BH26_ARAVE|nr:hypothetical protein AVEN_179490-1 [Araneus ventricosus]